MTTEAISSLMFKHLADTRCYVVTLGSWLSITTYNKNQSSLPTSTVNKVDAGTTKETIFKPVKRYRHWVLLSFLDLFIKLKTLIDSS